ELKRSKLSASGVPKTSVGKAGARERQVSFDAFYALLRHEDVISFLERYRWSEENRFSTELRFLKEGVDGSDPAVCPGIKDWLFLAPIVASERGLKTWSLGQVEIPVVSRARD